MKVIPPEIVDSIMTILSYAATAIVGWIARKLTNKDKQITNQKKLDNE